MTIELTMEEYNYLHSALVDVRDKYDFNVLLFKTKMNKVGELLEKLEKGRDEQ